MLIAGGGTGGHLFPGLAVAREFLDRDPGHRVLFVGTEHGLEAKAVPAAGLAFIAIPSRGIAGKGALEKLKGVIMIPRSLFAALRVVRVYEPMLALGVGGYVSGPVILAARLLGVPCAIQEQNAAPGYTNRILGRFVEAVFVSFAEAAASFPGASRKGRVQVAGNPIRQPIVDALTAPRPERDPQSISILVVGGSQGAHGLNLMFLGALREIDKPRRKKIRVRHQSGERDLEAVRTEYQELGIPAEVQTFIEDMAGAYLEADLIISRAGAGAVAEIALAGRPAILVPYPFAASDHQALNARALVNAGAALMFREGETDAGALARALTDLIENRDQRERMGQAARAAAKPNAAREIVDQCLTLMNARPERRAHYDDEK